LDSISFLFLKHSRAGHNLTRFNTELFERKMSPNSSAPIASAESDLQLNFDKGIPQLSSPALQDYFASRTSLIASEKSLRHDVTFKASMSPTACHAARILSLIRARELRDVWPSSYEDSLAEKNGGNLYPGMMFTLARERLEKTEVWKMVERMPKGALLHAHLDAMFDVDWLVEQALAQEGMCVLASEPLSELTSLEKTAVELRVFKRGEAEKKAGKANIWSKEYAPMTPVPIKEVASMCPGGEDSFKAWMIQRCTITPEESLCHHHGVDAIWRKFSTTMSIVDWIVMYEPIMRRALYRLLVQLAADGLRYVEVRAAFKFEYRKEGETYGTNDLGSFYEVIDDVVGKFKQSPEGKDFCGMRVLWTPIRRDDDRQIMEDMKTCISLKKRFPHLLSGFDFVAQEDLGRTLADLTPLLFWFKERCKEAGVTIPFFFHAGECLGDGDSTDNNLFDAILLGTRRIGHGYSLYKHPKLIDLVKERQILIESCPISNEILRLSSSIAYDAGSLIKRRGGVFK
jgi:adenosine deaminase CECR1